MDPEEDVLDIEVGGEDVEGMELEDPITTRPHRAGSEVGNTSYPQATEPPDMESNISIVAGVNSGTDNNTSARTSKGSGKAPKKRKRWRSKNPAVLEKQMQRIKTSRDRLKKKAQAELRAKLAAVRGSAEEAEKTQADTTSPSEKNLRDRIQYRELLPNDFGTYFHPGIGASGRNILPAGFYSDSEEDDFCYEDFLEPESPPWKKGKKKSQAQPTPDCGPSWTPEGKLLVEREKQIYFESPSNRMAKAAIRDRWCLKEREVLLLDSREVRFPRTEMPADTVGDLRKILQDPHRVWEAESPHNQSYDFRKPADKDEVIKDFLKEVQRTRVVCVNTEGTQLWVQEEDQEKRPRVMLTLAALNGRVLFFNDHLNVPAELLELLQDVSITKIGSGLDKEISELGRIGVTLTNWVDTGALRLALYSGAWGPFRFDPAMPLRKHYTFGARRYGIEELIVDLKGEGFIPAAHARTRYLNSWRRRADQGDIPVLMYPHIWENGRIPCAFLLMIVLDFARQRNLPEETPAMGILHEALMLCRDRDPENFQKTLEPSLRPQNWWFAKRGTGTQKEQLSIPTCSVEGVTDRRTFADFIEPLGLEEPVAVADRVYQRFFGTDPIPFPTCREMERDINSHLNLLRCACCGSRDHVSDCPKVRDPICNYEHDGEENLKPHTTEFCPVLHNYCGVCLTVGHLERVHVEKDFQKTGRELRERYFRFMAIGAYTSLPYLAFHPEGYKMLTAAHWRRSYDGRAYRQAIITRQVLGVSTELDQKLTEKARKGPGYKSFDLDRDDQLKAIRENIRKAETGDAVPLPRDLKMNFRAQRQRELMLRKREQFERNMAAKAAASETNKTKTDLDGTKTKKKRRPRHRKGSKKNSEKTQ